MRRIFNIKNLCFLLFIALINALTLNVNAVVTWESTSVSPYRGNSITISRTVNNVATSTLTCNLTYTLAADANNPSGASGAPTGNKTISFSSEAVSNSTATKTTTVSFSGMSFTEPGDYSYILTETATSNASNCPQDTASSYTIIVSVENVVDGTNHPTGDYKAYLSIKETGDTSISANKKAQADFTSTRPAGHIELTKEVTGNVAKLDDYFPFGIKIYAGGTYNITGLTAGSNLCSGVTTQTATTTVTGNPSSPTEKVICLKHGQTAIIGVNNSTDTIPSGARIDISEKSNTVDGRTYTTTYKVNSGSTQSGTSLTNHTLASGTTTIKFTNNSEEDTPTGILITILPYVLVIIGAVGGILVYFKINKKEEQEEEKKQGTN